MITLQRYGILNPPNPRHVWPLKVVAISTTPGLPSEIFVYCANLGSDPQYPGDIFECVASVSQLYDIGLAPVLVNSSAQTPYYRKNVLEFDCRSAEEAEDLWIKVKQDVTDLYNNFIAANNLRLDETVIIGSP
jgi:hypothetical protein